MVWKKTLIHILIGLFFVLSGCCSSVIQKKFYRTELGWERPKKNKFKLSRVTQNSEQQEIQGVYIMANSEHDIFYRFFNNNKFITSGFSPNLNLQEQFNNLKKGHIGYYHIRNNIIELEYFSVGSHDCGRYHQFKVDRIGDSIVGYSKIEVKGLTGVPNW